MSLEKLVEDFLPYAHAVGNRVGQTFPRDERRSVVQLAVVEAAWSWLEKTKSERGEFKFYLAKIVERMVRTAMTSSKRQTSRNGKDGLFARMMYEFAEARKRRVGELQQGELAELAETIRRKGYSVSIERLKGTQVGFSDTEASLDMPLYDGDCTFADVLTDSRAWRMNPEQLLIAKQESFEFNQWRRSPEKERQLLFSWIEWLPKRQRQVMLAAHVWSGFKKPNFLSMCAKRHGGNHTSDFGLGCSPKEAEFAYKEAKENLCMFAHGDFQNATFSEAVWSVPHGLVERFINTLSDPLEKYVVRQRLLTTHKQERDGYVLTGRPTISTVTRVWHARVVKRLGQKTMTREEAQEYVSNLFERVCRMLAVQVGIAPPEVLKKS